MKGILHKDKNVWYVLLHVCDYDAFGMPVIGTSKLMLHPKDALIIHRHHCNHQEVEFKKVSYNGVRVAKLINQ